MFDTIFDAIRANNKRAVQDFLEKGMDVTDSVDSETQLTPSNLALELDYDELAELLLEHEGLQLREKSSFYPCSKSQERFYFLDKIAPVSSTYHEHNILEFKLELNERIFQEALIALMQRHEALRTQYLFDSQGFLQQEVLPHVEIEFSVANHQDDEQFSVEDLSQSELHFIYKKFDLNHAPLWRVKLFYAPDHTCVVLLVFHHIVMDGFSMSVFFHDLLLAYQAIQRGDIPFSEQKSSLLQFRDYAAWENQWRSSDDYRCQLAYWQNRLKDYDAHIELPPTVFHSANKMASAQGHSLVFPFPKALHQQLVDLSRTAKVTPFVTYLAVYFLLLAKYTQQSDIVVGIPFVNRLLRGSETAMGCFINTVPLRCQLDMEKPFLTWLQDLNKDIQYDLANAQIPYSDISIKKDLIEVFFLYQLGLELQNDVTSSIQAKNVNHYTPGTAKYPISLELIQLDEQIHILVNYQTQHYDEQYIERLVTHYCQLITSVLHHPQQPIRLIDCLTEEETYEQLHTWNNTQCDYPASTIHQLFEQQVEKTPNNIALVFGDEHLSFQALNSRANQLAYQLRNQGVNTGSIVGLGAERSIEMVVGILAILKAGGAYLPLDLKHPDERLRYMLAETKLDIVLTQSHLVEKWKQLTEHQSLITLDSIKWHEHEFNQNLSSSSTHNDVAYIVYTSGSTGQPKGVMGLHMGMINRLSWMWSAYPYSDTDICCHKTSLNFVDAVAEFFMPLLKGIRLHMIDRDISENSLALGKYLTQHAITRIVLVPSLLRTMLETGETFSSIKLMVVSGEVLTSDLTDKIYQYAPHLTVINLYGSSEISADATYAEVFFSGKAKSLSIGRPIANMQAYILNQSLSLLPIGVPGELYIAGVGLASSYLYREDLTKERFFVHSFSDGKSIRLYKTGDLVRYLPDGQIDYLGRIDNQVKIRGFRVELEEIEAVLLKQPHVLNAAVVVREVGAGNKQLVSYVVVDDAHAFDAEFFKQQLAQSLPEYMIPTHFLRLDEMPFNINGKLDRRALPALDMVLLPSKDYVAPETNTQQALVALWSDLLHIPAEKISLTDHFLHLGGNSLLVMTLLARIESQWMCDISLKMLFTSPTLSEMARLIDRSLAHNISSASPLVPQERPAHIPLSFSQQRLWFIEQLLPGQALYHVPLALHLKGVCDLSALNKAYRALIERHEVLRTRFLEVEGQVTQIVDPMTDEYQLVVSDVKALPPHQIEAYLKNGLVQPFNLKQGPLLRAELLETSNNEYIFFMVMHHIITDGWSMQCFLREWHEWYQHFTLGLPEPEPLAVQYIDYTLWQKMSLKKEIVDEQLSYWQSQLKDVPEITQLPTDYPRPKELSYQGGRVHFVLSKDELTALNTCSVVHGVTLFTLLMSTLHIVLYHYCQQDQIVVGSPIANRMTKALERMIGFFVNTLAIKADFSSPLTVRELIAQMRETTLNAYAHQDLPFEQLVKELNISHHLNINPLFQVMLVYREQRAHPVLGNLEVALLRESDDDFITQFDLTMMAEHRGDEFYIGFEYAKDLFKKDTIEGFASFFKRAISCVIHQPDVYVHALPLLSESALKQQMSIWNDTSRPYPDMTIHALFEQRVKESPDAIALILDDQCLTYRELNERANQVAHYLREQGIGYSVDQFVGLGVERSFEMIIGMLGILKAGAAYVPFDPTFPKDRLAYMLNDLKLTVFLTQENLLAIWADLSPTDGQIQFISLSDTVFSHYSVDNLSLAIKPNQLAYVIYTSGSTGVPKGAMIEHHCVIELCINNTFIDVQIANTVAGFSNYAFDGSIFDIFFPLLNGKKMLILSKEVVLDPQALSQSLIQACADTMFLTTALFNHFYHLKDNPLLNLKTILFGGEKANEDIVNAFAQRYPNINLVHVYGPTETVVFSTYFNVKADNWTDSLPIGTPLANKTLYVLGKNKEILPVGTLGELYIGGKGLARGYLNRDDLTAERFFWHRFDDSSAPVRLYKTGDIVRYLPDGNIIYVGRTDNQVKIRGFRVELEEIEKQILRQPNIKSVAVIVKQKAGNHSLVAFIEAEYTDKERFLKDLKHRLSDFLPDYMIPAYMSLVAEMPLNSTTGKADRKKLKELAIFLEQEENHQAPESEIEKQLAFLWSTVLELPVEEIGVDDNFFEKGGHSLLIASLLSKVRDQWNIDISLKTLFGLPSLRSMAKEIERSLVSMPSFSYPPLVKQAYPEHIPLSFSQQRLWFIEQLIRGKALYQVPMILKLNGACDVAAFSRAYSKIIERHESLRTSFQTFEGNPIQVIHPAEHIPGLDVLTIASISDLSLHLSALISRPFELSDGPLLRGELITLDNDQYIFAVVMHHIITDGWSLYAYVQELKAWYEHFSSGASAPEMLSIQYVDYALWQRSWLQQDILENQLNYWKAQLKGVPELIAFPTDYPRLQVPTYRGDVIAFEISDEEMAQLKTYANEKQVTMFMLMLAMWQMVLYRYTQQSQVVVGTPIANRVIAAVEPLIGFFVNTLVIKADFSSTLTIEECIEQIKQTTLDAFAHQDVPFEHVVNHLNILRKPNINPVFQVMFTYQEQQKPVTIGTLETQLYREVEYTVARFDLTLNVERRNHRLYANIEYATDLFKRETIARLADHFMQVLRGVIHRPGDRVDTMAFLTASEIHEQTVTWLGAPREYPDHATVHELFEEQAALFPDAIALTIENQALTYAELNSSANRLAHYLRAQGITKPDTLIGLGTDRSFEMMVGMLAILKVGGAYVPMDPTYPDDRLEAMLADAQLPLLLTQSHLTSRWERLSRNHFLIVAIDELMNTKHYSSTNIPSVSGSEHLVYVMYTSGSTGKPKGVMIEHRGVVSLVKEVSYIAISSQDRFLFLSDPAFDAATFEIWGALLNGAMLRLISKPLELISKPILFGDYLRGNEISILWLTKSLFDCIYLANPRAFQSLNYLLVGGEALNVKLVKQLVSSPYSPVHFINGYGPTENTTFSCTYEVTSDVTSVLPIGKVLTHRLAYVLDAHQQLLPVGALGELYVGGPGLARGYLNRDDLTQACFISHRFSESLEPIRLYKTGDMVRYLPDNNIVYMGRIDNQIKIRGFRVELGDIESVLQRQELVRQAAVKMLTIAQTKQLVAYVVVHQQHQSQRDSVKKLQSDLAIVLPDYMIPAHIIILDEMPLTATGKIDYKALPFVNTPMLQRGGSLIEPEDPLSKEIAQVWAELLHIKLSDIGVQDDFFKLGGHSLLAIKLLYELKNQFAIDVSIGEFYQNPTIDGLCTIRDAASRLDPNLMLVGGREENNPIFLIHSIVGLASHYSSIVPALAGYTVYGVNFEGILSGDLKEYASLEELASDYIQKIKTASPHGPYRLGGWSLGGIIALEMSRQLQAAGEKVELVLLLDAVYHVTFELEEYRYIQIFMRSLLAQLDARFLEESQLVERFSKVADHLQRHLLSYSPRYVDELIDKVALIKCQGSLTYLGEQKRENLEWSGVDFFNGLKYFFREQQLLNVRTIACNHYELFDQYYELSLNQKIRETLLEDKTQSFDLGVQGVGTNLMRVREQGDMFAWRRLLSEAEYLENSQQLLDITERNHFYWLPKLGEDIENQCSSLNQDDARLDLLELSRKNFRLNGCYLFSIWRKYSTKEINLNIIISLLEISPAFTITSITNLLKNIFILRFISAVSLELVAASIMDETVLLLPLTLALQFNYPMVHYLNQKLDSNAPKKVGEAFDAGLLLNMMLFLPIMIYSVFSQDFMRSIGAQELMARSLGQLTLTRLLAVIPMLANITIEQYYAVLCQRYQLSVGAALDAVFTVGSLALFQRDDRLNARTLGYAIAIGSFSKCIYYSQHLIRQGDWSRYGFARSFPVRMMYQYLYDGRKFLLASTFPFINYLVLAILVLHQRGALELAGYKVARMAFEVIIAFAPVITASSSILMSRFLLSNQFENAFVLGVTTLSVGLILAVVPSLVFGFMSGEDLTKTFISLDQIPFFAQALFFKNIEKSIGYFIGLGFSQMLQMPLMSYLMSHFAFTDILKIFTITYLVFTNAGLLGMYYGYGDSIKDLIKITLSGSLLTIALLFYKWLTSSHFQLESTRSRIEHLDENTVSTKKTSNVFLENSIFQLLPSRPKAIEDERIDGFALKI